MVCSPTSVFLKQLLNNELHVQCKRKTKTQLLKKTLSGKHFIMCLFYSYNVSFSEYFVLKTIFSPYWETVEMRPIHFELPTRNSKENSIKEIINKFVFSAKALGGGTGTATVYFVTVAHHRHWMRQKAWKQNCVLSHHLSPEHNISYPVRPSKFAEATQIQNVLRLRALQ